MNSLLFDFGMATAPITGYVMQYRMIVANKSVGAFSIDICLVLLFANILRINFFLFEQYQIALLFQSLFMVTAQVLLLKICTKYREQNNRQLSSETLASNKQKDEDQNQDFWRWKNFQSYQKRIIWFAIWTLLFSIIMKIIGLNIYGDFVGLIALLSQSVLILPQIIQIFKQKRAGGISYSLISLNLIGDIIKLYYFFMKNQAFQFKLCGVIQLILDIFVIFQIAYFQWGQGMTELKEDNGDMELPKKSGNIILDENRVDQLEGSSSRTSQLQQNIQDIEQQNQKDAQTE